ncbi:hypothetical protein GCM10022280_09430 [Sphingomonas swuensis]|uniref:HTH luxR-type domain-containing protein n=1 Tax=Sphingomonas swuensis TaxID=977800 RepID=A0ABP7SL54_9SPHN
MAYLTERQQQVIVLVARGKPHKVIARELGISPCTVKAHVQAAFRMLNVHSRYEATAILSLESCKLRENTAHRRAHQADLGRHKPEGLPLINDIDDRGSASIGDTRRGRDGR